MGARRFWKGSQTELLKVTADIEALGLLDGLAATAFGAVVALLGLPLELAAQLVVKI